MGFMENNEEMFRVSHDSKNLVEVLAQITSIEQDVMQSGRVDGEPDQFASIKLRLQNKDITPEQALNEVQGIILKRQDYN